MLKKLFLILLISSLSIASFGYDFEVDGIYYNTISLQDMTCEITYKNNDIGYNNTPYYGNFIIPTSVDYDGKTFFVIKIGDKAFNCCGSLKSVSIPNSVITIGNSAFSNCPKLKSIVIPNSVSSIDAWAFRDCYDLSSITIPNSVTSIGTSAFYGCTGLTSIEIPNSINVIESGTFSGCSSLEFVTISNSVNTIGGAAFYDCSKIKEIVSLAVTPPKIYDNTAFGGVPKANLLLKVPEESVTLYQEADYWNTFWNIIGLNDENVDDPSLKKCEKPTIELVNGNLVVTSLTNESLCYTSITSDDFKGWDSNEPIELSGLYNISSYAHAPGYLNSETVTAKLAWVNPTIENANTLSIDAKKAVLIRVQNGNIIVSGTESGESIQLYSLDGIILCTVTAEDFQTMIPCAIDIGNIVIIKYGSTSVKIVI